MRTKIKAALQRWLNINNPNANIDDYDFELEIVRKYQQIEDGKVNFTFDLINKSGKNVGGNSERIINDNDIYLPIGYALGWINTPLAPGEAPGSGNYQKIENQVPYYFPNALVFNATDPAQVDQYQALNSVYYGTMTISAGNDQLVSNFPLCEMLKIPRFSSIPFYFNYPYTLREYAELTEYPVLNGAEELQVDFNVPAADTVLAGGDPATTRVFAEFKMLGFKVKRLAAPFTELNAKRV
ncbi:hypothetical protein [Winogradskyella sp.]|uniref:hypothetical protein n=1 Tax=Winogradskyella sp. TaxID=1883156 RepID=UPI0026372777|nr:hypothetical protein [Winogradskyella sp.]